MGISRRPQRYSRRRGGRAPARVRGDKKEGFILTVVDGPQSGKEYFFDKSASIGRVETNDIILVEPGISRSHARFYDDQGIYLVEDLGSANGTRLNGAKVEEPEVLRDGDYITVASTTLQFSQLAAARGDVTAQTALSDVEAQAIDATNTSVDHEQPRGLKGFVGSRRGKVVLLLLLLIVGGAGYYIKSRATGELIVIDQSTVPVTYSDEDAFFNAVFGYGKYDDTHLNQVIIQFEYLGGRATLQYGAWGVDKVGELVVVLNGERLGKVPLTMNRWVYGLKMNLPRDKLRRGKTNEIVFNNTFNPPRRERWEVCYVVIRQEAIPPPDPKEARAQFNLAKKTWEDREIEPGNMYEAFLMFRRARDLLEGLPEKGQLYQDAVDYIDRVDKALTRVFSEGLFSARRAERLDNDYSKARSILLRTRTYFHKDDFRYREIQRYLDALAGQ